MSYYQDLTIEEQNKVLGAMAGLKLNAKDRKITRQDINVAFAQALGRPLSMEYMRDPSVVQLLSLEGYGVQSALKVEEKPKAPNQFASTDSHLAARGLPTPKAGTGTVIGSTRYSAKATTSAGMGGYGGRGRTGR